MAQEKLFKWIQSKEFGSGQTSITAYTTAWAVRVKSPKKPKEPAFPSALQWLRDNQKSDGSWGVDQPFNIFDRMLSTVAALIALKQWNTDEDQTRIETAVQFIKDNWQKLSFYDRIPWQMTIGFDVIFPVLVEQAKELLGIDGFGDQKVIDLYIKARDKRLKRYKKSLEEEKKQKEKEKETDQSEEQEKKEETEYDLEDMTTHEKENTMLDPNSWYYLIEGFEDELYPKDKINSMVGLNYLVASSYAGTAFALTKGEELPNSFAALKKVIDARGGMPLAVPFNIKELAMSLNYLIWAGVDTSHPAVKSQLDKLEKIFTESNGSLGASPELPADADTTANAVHALCATKRIHSTDQLSGLMKFYHYDKFTTFESEHWRERSVSTNLNCVLALKHFQGDDQLKSLFECDLDKFHKQAEYLIDDTGFDMEDKWHLSKYYCLSRAVFAWQDLDQEYTDICYRIMLHFQNDDGGWGRKGLSTPAESAYCIIAIMYWYKLHGERLEKEKKCPPIPALPVIRKAKTYMDEVDDQLYPMWLDKVPYALFNVDKTAILAAKYVLEANETRIK